MWIWYATLDTLDARCRRWSRCTSRRTTWWTSTSLPWTCSKVHMAHQKLCKHHIKVKGTIYQLILELTILSLWLLDDFRMDVVLDNVDLEDGPIDLIMMLTKVLMCHVYFWTCSWRTCWSPPCCPSRCTPAPTPTACIQSIKCRTSNPHIIPDRDHLVMVPSL